MFPIIIKKKTLTREESTSSVIVEITIHFCGLLIYKCYNTNKEK